MRVSRLLLAVMLLACAHPAKPGAGQGGAKAARDDDPISLLPSGAEALLYVDVARLKQAPLLVRAEKMAPKELERLRTVFGFDPIADVESAAIGLYQLGDHGEALFVVRGRFDVEKVLAAFAASGPGSSVRGEHRGVPLVDRGAESMGFPTARVLVYGSRAAFRRAVDRAFGIGPSVEEDRELETLWRSAAGAGPGVVRLVLVTTERLRDRSREELGDASEVRTLSGRLDLEDGIDLSLIADVQDAGLATRVDGEAQRRLRDLARQPAIALFGLAQFLDGITVLSQGARVLGSLRLNQERLDALLGRLEQIAEMRRRAGEEHP